MQLQELTTYEDKSHLKIVRVHFVIADHADPTKRKEWIEGQISTVLPIVRNGLRLRAEALEQVRDTPDSIELLASLIIRFGACACSEAGLEK